MYVYVSQNYPCQIGAGDESRDRWRRRFSYHMEELPLCHIFGQQRLRRLLTRNFPAHIHETLVLITYVQASFMGLVARKLSSGYPTKRDSNQPVQLQRPARKLKFHL